MVIDIVMVMLMLMVMETVIVMETVVMVTVVMVIVMEMVILMVMVVKFYVISFYAFFLSFSFMGRDYFMFPLNVQTQYLCVYDIMIIVIFMTECAISM